jgi:hypothetical protein
MSLAGLQRLVHDHGIRTVATLLALPAAVLIGTQFRYADRAIYVFGYAASFLHNSFVLPPSAEDNVGRVTPGSPTLWP